MKKVLDKKETAYVSRNVAAVYDRMTDFYSSLPVSAADRMVIRQFIETLPTVGRVIEIGCGAGRITKLLTSKTAVTAIDVLSAMVRCARRRVMGAEFDNCSIWDLTPERFGLFDGAVAFHSLNHVKRSSVTAALRNVGECLTCDGTLCLALRHGEGVLKVSAGVSIEIAQFTRADMTRKLNQAGFRATSCMRVGRQLYILAKRSR